MSTEELSESIDPTVTAPMADTEPQTAAGKVLWHFTMSLDGVVTGPNHEMDWMTGISSRAGLAEEYVETVGAVLGGRNGWDHTARPRTLFTRSLLITFLGDGREAQCHAFNPRDPRLLYRQRLRSLCLDTRYNARRLGSARVSRGSRGTPTCGVASGTSVV